MSPEIDQITAAIAAALTLGASSGLTAVSKASIVDAYKKLKNSFISRFGGKSKVVEAITSLENEPSSNGRKMTLHEEIIKINAIQDSELLAAAEKVLEHKEVKDFVANNFTNINQGTQYGTAFGTNSQSTINIHQNRTFHKKISLDDTPCPICKKRKLEWQSQSNGRVILVCSNCHKSTAATFDGEKLIKIAVLGTGIVLTGAEIADYMHNHSDVLTELIASLLDLMDGL